MSELAVNLINENKRTQNSNLDLGNCGLNNQLPPELLDCVWLENLNLGDYARLNNEWASCTNQGALNSFPEAKLRPLENLPSLKSLYLGNCRLSNIDFVENFPSLSELCLDRNEILNIDVVATLPALEYLYLSYNRIQNINVFEKTNPLYILDLAYNDISDINPLSKHSTLLFLNLDYNKIRDFSVLEKITAVKYLYLRSSQIENIDFLKQNLDLITLALSENKISNINSLGNLKQLQSLYLESNQIAEFPNSLLNSLPKLKSLYLFDNPIQNIPIEIYGQQYSDSFSKVKDYFNSLSKPEEVFPCYEAKLLLVGRGQVGKSELAEALSAPNYQFVEGRPSTEGLKIKQWHLECDNPQKEKVDLAINLWDLGSQESYYGTHQFFLTKNSLYLLVWDARQEEDNMTFGYWLRALSLLSENSPVLIVQNKADNRTKMLDQNDLQTHFPFIQNFYQVSCKYPEKYDLAKLKMDIVTQLFSLPHVGELWNIRRINVRQKLEKESRNYIQLSEYYAICEGEGITKKEALFLSERLHRLGIILHFQDDAVLQSIVILKPEWATKAFYKIIDSKKIKDEQNGNFALKDLREVWDSAIYADKFPELLQLMNRFELSFQFQDQDRYIVPELCVPSASFDLPIFINKKDLVRFEYRYDFMPKNIITRFICRNHKLIHGEKFWRSGVVLNDESTIAVVQSSEVQKKITVTIEGEKARLLLYKIRKDMEEIHETVKNPAYDEMVQCICSRCLSSDKPEYFKYSKIKRYIENRESTIKCDESLINVSLKDLMEGILENQQEKLEEKAITASIKQVLDNTQTKQIKTIQLFLASSSELKEDREQFEIFINRENKSLHDEQIFIKLELWEDFIDAMSKTKLQDEYNKVIQGCDIFVSLFFSKVGKHTTTEFNTAFGQFTNTGKPFIYTYFKDAPINMSQIKKADLDSKVKFENKLEELGHYPTLYKSVEDLKYQFKKQLEKIMDKL